MLHVFTHIVYLCPIRRLPLHITVARRRSRCLLGGRAAKLLLIGGGSLSFFFGAEHVCVSARMEEYHLSVNATMRLVPCFLRVLILFSNLRRKALFCCGRGRTAAGPPSLGKHGHKDGIVSENAISPSPLAVLYRTLLQVCSTCAEYVNDQDCFPCMQSGYQHKPAFSCANMYHQNSVLQ